VRKDVVMLRRRAVLAIVAAVVALTCVSFVLPIPGPWGPVGFFVAARRADAMRARLLCETDHKALLEACREIIRWVDEGKLKPGMYKIRGGSWQPEVSCFPQVILDLAPQYVLIDERYVKMPMHGAAASFGVFAYPEDFKEPHPGFLYGHRKLIEGLWYYDDGYVRDYDSQYAKKIDALLQKRKK